MSPKDRPIPAGSSPLAKPPKLTPKTTPLRVGDAAGNTDEPPQEQPAPRPRTARRTGTPSAADAVAMTVRVDPDEALDIDDWIHDLRWETGRRKLDKSEVIRELIRLGRESPSVRRSLVSRLGPAKRRKATS